MKKTDYTAQKTSSSIVIDGDISKEPWKSAGWSKRFCDMVTGDAGMYNTQTAICWNDQYLYIAFYAEEPFVEAHLTERDSIVFLENDLEVFIDGGDCYYELEVNAANTVYFFGLLGVNEWIVIFITTLMWLLNVVIPVVIGSYYVLNFKLKPKV